MSKDVLTRLDMMKHEEIREESPFYEEDEINENR
jgi:hypothetical protein